MLVAVLAILLVGGGGYRLNLEFSDASGLVDGDSVLIGPAKVGEIHSVSLTRNGLALVVIGLDGDASPLHAGTVARIEDAGLASIAGHYVTLQPGPTSAPTLASGATLGTAQTHAEVSLDEVFDAFDPLTRAGLAKTIQGEAAAIQGRSGAANEALEYLDPALGSTAAVTAALTHSEGAFDRLLVSGAGALGALAGQTSTLTRLVSSTATATGAIARQAGALDRTLVALPGTLTDSTRTLSTLRSTLDVLTPVVAVAKPAVVQLVAFSAALQRFAGTADPTVAELAGLLPATAQMLAATPSLAAVARRAFPDNVAAMNASQTQLDGLREYTPDLVAALTNVGQASSYYDANGHYTRTQPFFDAFSVDAQNQLVPRSPADRYAGLTRASARCPGAAVQASPDGSAPDAVPGCDATETP